MTCFESAPANKKRLTLIAVFVMLFASVIQSGTDSVILHWLPQRSVAPNTMLWQNPFHPCLRLS